MRGQRGGWLAVLLLALMLWATALPLHAAEPPPGSSAADQAERQVERPLNNAPVWRAVRSGEEHFTTVRGPEAGVLIQSEGNTWRQLRNGPVTLYGGWLLILVPSAILLFWMIKGTMKLHGQKTGRKMLRFSGFERFVHWGTAISFLLLAVTGVAILFGKHVLLPLIGHGGLGLLLNAGKLVHNYVGPLFGGLRAADVLRLPARQRVAADRRGVDPPRRRPARRQPRALRALQLRREDLVLVRRHHPRLHRGGVRADHGLPEPGRVDALRHADREHRACVSARS